MFYASSLYAHLCIRQVLHKAQVNINKYHFKKASIKQLLLTESKHEPRNLRGFCGLKKTVQCESCELRFV